MAASARAQNMSRSAPSRLDARSAAVRDELNCAASDATTTLLVKASFMGAATRTISAHIRAQVSDRPTALQQLAQLAEVVNSVELRKQLLDMVDTYDITVPLPTDLSAATAPQEQSSVVSAAVGRSHEFFVSLTPSAISLVGGVRCFVEARQTSCKDRA